jgi:hypothetical protein
LCGGGDDRFGLKTPGPAKILTVDEKDYFDPAAIAFAEMAELRRRFEEGLLVEGRDYDIVNVDEEIARECFKPGALE